MEVKLINPTDISGFQLKRVAAYARVSTDKDDAEHSLEAQISNYNEYITGYPGWIFAGIYADDGISGTKTNRPEFQRMMEDARAGKFDIIVTKSITRFARNIVLLLSSVRELKSLGIDVIFEKENLRSMSEDGELMLSLLAMYAEEEARSASENKHWQIQKQFEEGRPTYFRIYGYKWVDGRLQVVPEEAKVVQDIFRMYLSGMGRDAIARCLNQKNVPTPTPGFRWLPYTIFGILRNEKYVGDLLLQKTFRPDFRTKKKCYNRGQWRQFYVEGAHEAIIDKETFRRTQLEIEARKHSFCQRENYKAPSRLSPDTLFRGLIICGNCKKRFCYKNMREKSSDTHIPLYLCATLLRQGAEYCNAKRIRESILIDKTREALNLDPDTEITRELILSHITSIESATDNRLRFFLKDGSVKVIPWGNPFRKHSWTPEMKQRAREKTLALNKARKEADNA